MDDISIRHCAPGDYDAVVDIYNHYIEHSHATFDATPYSMGERAPWFSQFHESGPNQLLVADNNGIVLGFCCSTPFHNRSAYDISVETTVYLAAEATGQGIGKWLYEELLNNLSGIGLHGAYAGVALPNDASVNLHEALGFRKVGVYEEVGYKFGQFWSVAWFELRMQESQECTKVRDQQMANGKSGSASAELRAFLKKHPDAEVMELLIADLPGVLRGKRIRRKDFEKTFADGFCLPASAVLLDTLGDVIDGMRFGSEDGDPDIDAFVVPGSLATVPWAKKPSAQALFRFYSRDGKPFFADPRFVLENAAAPIRKMGLKIVMATELEFYLLDAKTDRPTARVARVPGIGRPQPGPQVYNPDDLWDIEAFLNELNAVCEAQKIPSGTATSEFAPGQFEINLQHIDDPVLACDHAVLLKRAIKAMARQHGYVACFMAKPFEEDSGSGLHIHMSLVDKQGKNYFSQGKEKMAAPPFSARFRNAIGGLVKTMAEGTAIFAPNANSYRRLRPEMFAPVEPNWGANHRNVAIRVPLSDAKNLRFEHRVSGADANPYLVTAALLAGVHYGLKNRCDPGLMVEEGQVIRLKNKIPNRWDVAIDKFEKSKVFPEYFGKDYCQLYVANRRDEARRFHNVVSNIDFDWYMRAV